jgi:quercetin dioxygenase-like cupin family protein
MDENRRNALTVALLAPAALGASHKAAAAVMAKPQFMSKDGTAIVAKRTFTDADGKTHCDTVEWKATPVAEGGKSIVPPGCTRFYEGKAVSMLIRQFIPGMKTDYHTDPAGEHQVTFMYDGHAAVGAKDGSSFILGPGEFASVEDDHGEGHSAVDATGKGFTQLFVAVPAK